MTGSSWQVIIKLGYQGETLTVYGKKNHSNWIYMIGSENDQNQQQVDSWQSLIDWLQDHDWFQAYPMFIDQGFGSYFWNEFQKQHVATANVENWVKSCFTDHQQLLKAKRWLQEEKRIIVLTGAGMSTDSGVPDFRSSGGLWAGVDPQTIASPEAIEQNYQRFCNFYRDRILQLQDIKPHEGHEILTKWHKQGIVTHLATQNVDRLHQKSGFQKIDELHGSIEKIYCYDCNKDDEMSKFLNEEPCQHCGGRLRPGIVLFGEVLPEKPWTRTLKAIEKADLVIVIGTSLQVYPVNQLPLLTNGKTMLINQERVDMQDNFDVAIKRNAKEAILLLDELLSSENEKNEKKDW
ncbi:NAD-dependent deacylase [Texcoconibacillus texcoconensis]|uniref:protein acetyllysine N-acetyltransferase n=1 Tax=Texcoconibacillus texcoconensis TaxID=1095777 RepID=A0A840QQL6_9BACI|nr:NAD-dependent deacylase [Texcoconibacillus texcoconensis]MBB5173650.1 NAD-dependent SIR2 family protein deacetylase [Texcoconibacillus texcoconensis]